MKARGNFSKDKHGQAGFWFRFLFQQIFSASQVYLTKSHSAACFIVIRFKTTTDKRMFQSDSIFYLKFYASSHQPKVYNQSALQMIWHGFNMASTSSPIPLYYGNWQNILGAAISPRRRPQLWHLLSLARYVSFQYISRRAATDRRGPAGDSEL